jgi:hypothetical protein
MRTANFRARPRRSLPLVLLAVVLLGLVGCATSAERRIGRNPALFQSLPVETQERVRAGEVAIGDSPEIVLLALGRPDRRVTQRTEREERIVWIYEQRILYPDPLRMHEFGHGRHWVGDPFAHPDTVIVLDRPAERRYARARLEFVGDRLVAIQQVEQ